MLLLTIETLLLYGEPYLCLELGTVSDLVTVLMGCFMVILEELNQMPSEKMMIFVVHCIMSYSNMYVLSTEAVLLRYIQLR